MGYREVAVEEIREVLRLWLGLAVGLPSPGLRTIAAQARHVAWLNPEPHSSWDTGDSVAGRYAKVVDMHECRNIDQLRRFVARALPV